VDLYTILYYICSCSSGVIALMLSQSFGVDYLLWLKGFKGYELMN
jgi:hypothetical protein